MSAPSASRPAVAGIFKLPNEILDEIIGHLMYASDINNLGMTCRTLRSVADHVLYPKYAQQYTPTGMSRVARGGTVKSVRKLFASGACLERYSNASFHHSTPMDEAAKFGRLDLFQAFAEVLGMEQAFNSVTTAMLSGHLDVVEYLIRMGLSSEAALRMVITACRDCPLTTVEFLVDSLWLHFDATLDDTTPMETAIGAGRLDVVKCLLRAGATMAVIDLKGPFESGTTVLQIAKSNNVEMVRFLLECGLEADGFSLIQLQDMVHAGADYCAALIFEHMRKGKMLKRPELLSTENKTALLVLAAAIEDEALFRHLLDNIRIIKEPSEWNLPTSCAGFDVAIQRGREGMVKAYLDKLRDEIPFGLADEYRSAVSEAIRAGQTSLVVMILDHATSAWVEVDDNTHTWLDQAAKIGDVSTFLLLQERGCLEYFANQSVHSALQRRLAGLGKELGTHFKGNVTELEQVLRLNDSQLPRELCHQFRTGIIGALATHWDAKNFDEIFHKIPDFKGQACYKAFANAMDALCFETVQVCLQRSLDPNCQLLTQSKDSAPSLARCVRALFRNSMPEQCKVEACLRIMRKLVEYGADVDAVDKANRSALHHAIAAGETSPQAMAIFEELLKLGADPLVRLYTGQSPLQSAVDSGRPDMVELCLKDLWDRGTLELKWSALDKVIPVPRGENDGWEAYEKEAARGSVMDKMRTWGRFSAKKTLYKYKWRIAYPPPAPWGWDDEI